jgi:transposase
MIPVAAGVRIWIASGHTDMRKGMNGLALLVQEGLGRDPFAGDVFVFRGRAGSLIKALWHDGIGLSLYAKAPSRYCAKGWRWRAGSAMERFSVP